MNSNEYFIKNHLEQVSSSMIEDTVFADPCSWNEIC